MESSTEYLQMTFSSWWKYQQKSKTLAKNLEILETGAVLEAGEPLGEFMNVDTEEGDVTGVNDRASVGVNDQSLTNDWKVEFYMWILARQGIEGL